MRVFPPVPAGPSALGVGASDGEDRRRLDRQSEEPCSSCDATIVKCSDWGPGSSRCWRYSLAFGALGVAASANSKSNDAKEVAAVGGAGATKVTLSEFKLDPSMISAPVDGTITVTNGGTVDHNFAVQNTDVRTKTLNPGESATVSTQGPQGG